MGKKFWRHYFLYIIFLLIIISLVWVTLWYYLDAYEKSMPENYIIKVSSWYEKRNIDNILKYIEIKDDDFNTKEVVKTNLENILKEGNITYEKKASEHTKEKPVYIVLKDNDEIATIYLKSSKNKTIFKTIKWDVKKIQNNIPSKTIKVSAPSDVKILVNGKSVSENFIKDKNYYSESIVAMSNYISGNVLYEIDNIYDGAKVTFNGEDGIILDDTYTYKFPKNDELLQIQSEFIKSWCMNYTKYVVNEAGFGSIAPYVLPGSNAYGFLQTVANTNIWLASHTPTEFSEIKFNNMQMYNDNAFSVEVSYDYSFLVGTDKKEYQTNLTLYMINQNGNWLIANLLTY